MVLSFHLFLSARVITNLYQTGDMTLVANLLIGFILNLSVVIACTIYSQDRTVKSSDEQRKKTT